jgi:acetolactate synthase-1/2/3 large subunit
LQGRHAELWQFEEIDFGRVAESLGAIGVRVDRPHELHGALDGAFEQAERARVPVVVDVQTEMTAMAPTGYLE